MKKLFIVVSVALFFVACNNESKTGDTAAVNTDSSASKKMPAGVEMLGDELNAGEKASWDAFSRGDIEAFTANFDENARMSFSGGDSLVGKKAIIDYHKGRWKIIDSLKFSESIWLPIKGNEKPNNVTPAGKWMLSWHQVDVKYKNGKKLTFWAHNANHYNDAGKVDLLVQYIDRHPIREATKGLVQ